MSEYKGYTQQQKIATQKYKKKVGIVKLGIEVKKDDRERWKQQAAERGMSLTAYISYLIEKDRGAV